eukprot:TsM_001202800 transcript=TsM_001202800 gene=TsM_001202800
MESQGDDEGGKRLVPSFHTCSSSPYGQGSIHTVAGWHTLMDLELRISTARHGLGWQARRRPLREGARAQVEGPFLAGDGAPTLVWAPAQAAPGTAEPEREGKPERGCSSLCPHEGARAPSGPRCSSEALRGGSGKAPKAQAPRRGRMEA